MDTKKQLTANDRMMTLNNLVNFSRSLNVLSSELKKFSWDYTGLPVNTSRLTI
jgi:hypothetical protein